MKTRSITSEDFEKYVKSGYHDFGFEDGLTYAIRGHYDNILLHGGWNLV